MYGLPLVEYVTALPPGYWMARAIYKPGNTRWTQTFVELLWDRQGFKGDADEKYRKDLARWINKKGLNRLRKELYLRAVSTADRCLVVVSDAPFYLYADPRASYGYLYLAAWKENTCRNEKSNTLATNPLPV